MAFTPVVPVSLNIQVTQGLAQEFIAPVVNNPSGSPVDLSAWVSMAAAVIPLTPAVNQTALTIGTVTGGTGGALSLQTGASDFSTSAPGSARIVISGKPTSGDAAQVLATGIVTLGAA